MWSLSFQEEESITVFSKSVLGSSRKILPLYPLVKTNSRGNPNSRGEEIDCLLMQEMAKNLWPSLIQINSLDLALELLDYSLHLPPSKDTAFILSSRLPRSELGI